jgi:hypothetical protein
MMELFFFLGDLASGLVGLFRKSTARRARQYRLIGVAIFVGWLAIWAVASFGPEGWRLALFLVGTLLMAIAMFCGYMRLAESGTKGTIATREIIGGWLISERAAGSGKFSAMRSRLLAP